MFEEGKYRVVIMYIGLLLLDEGLSLCLWLVSFRKG